ncbi:MAG: SRPBCC family protein [Candidatus Omnitrophica bacterium]|nr:SRPBCC family protein [Candidatus Omnitrophota bacterium]
MNRYQGSFLFKAPLEKVWAVWSDVEKMPEWVHGVEAVEPGEGEMGEGYTWKEMCQFDQLPVPLEHSVTQFEAQRRAVIYTVLPMGGTMEKTVTFEPEAGGTRVHIQAEWDLGMIGAFLKAERFREKVIEGLEKTAERWIQTAEKS